MEGYIRKAETLIEALPYIREFTGKTVVVKYGGAAMKDDARMASFAQDVVLLQYVGIRPVVVHGGGPQIDRMLERLSIPTRRAEGLRVTSPEAMEVVEMVLGGTVNQRIVALINTFGGKAVGLSGKDGGLILATKSVARSRETGEPLDLGLVGDVKEVRPELLRALDADGFVPVIAPIGAGEGGEAYNINGDTAAAAVAAAVSAEKFILLTDVAGVLDPKGGRISTMTGEEAESAIRSGAITGGMIPKVECGLAALRGGVGKSMSSTGGCPTASSSRSSPTPESAPRSSGRSGSGRVMTGAEAIALTQRYQMGNYSRFAVTFVRGEGSWLYDDLGKPYLDFLGGIAVAILGTHTRRSRARSRSRRGAWCTSPTCSTSPPRPRWGSACPGRRPGRFFCNSGTEANEAAIKLARRWTFDRHGEGRHGIVVLEGSFHGRTYGGLSATAQPKFHQGFEPLLPGFVAAPLGDIDALDQALTDRVSRSSSSRSRGRAGSGCTRPAT